MKIVCDACSAKYSIADEKVRGKVFKIRCKKCSNIIVVRGGDEAEGPAPAEHKETRVFNYAGYEQAGGGEAVWHLVIDQGQVGPMTMEEVRRRVAVGEVDGETYVWREGFADWVHLQTVPELTSAPTLAAASEPQLGADHLVDSAASEANADPHDLFAMRGSGAAIVGDLFAPAPTMADEGFFGGAAEPQPAAAAEAAPLRGQRNENSVLFSLNNLAALANDPVPAQAPPLSSSGAGMALSGGGEGSGLIDIRSMAQVYLGEQRGPKAASAGTGSINDLPVFSASAFESASPVLIPVAAAPANNKLLYGLLAMIGLLVIAAAVLLVVVLTGDKPGGAVAVAPVAPGAILDKPENPDRPAAENGNPTEPSEATKVESPPDPDNGDPETTDPEVREPPRRDPKTTTRTPRVTTSEPKTTTPTRETPTRAPTAVVDSACDQVACLVEPDKPCCRKYRSSSANPSNGGGGGSSDLPERLSKSDVSSGVAKVRGRVTSCGDKHGGGMVRVKMKIEGDGGVSSASATGGSDALNNCVASAAKGAKFRKSQKGVTVTYPFVLK